MGNTPTDFVAALNRLLSVPWLEGTFRVREGGRDVTDAFSELRFKDPRFGGYLDRSRVEQSLASTPLTLWLRGAWAAEVLAPGRAEAESGPGPLPEAAPNRNQWIVVVPPGADLRVVSPRRSFAMLKTLLGGLEQARPFTVRGGLVVGRAVEVTAGPDGLIVQLDWLFESAEVNLASAVGTDLTSVRHDWHTAPIAELVERLGGQVERQAPSGR